MGFPNKETQFKKGTSGNPKGRPKMPDIKDALAKVLSDEQEGGTTLEVILKKQGDIAREGDTKAAEFLMNRGYGKPKQSIEQTVTSTSVIRLPQKKPVGDAVDNTVGSKRKEKTND